MKLTYYKFGCDCFAMLKRIRFALLIILILLTQTGCVTPFDLYEKIFDGAGM